MFIRSMLLLTTLAMVTPASAKPWNVIDLGRLLKDEHCMLAAARTFKTMLAEYGANRLRASDWITFADGVGEHHDALITCGYSGMAGARATLVVHSRDRHIDAHFITRRISVVFEGHAQQITQEWRDSIN